MQTQNATCNKTRDKWNEVQFIPNVAAGSFAEERHASHKTYELQLNNKMVVYTQENLYICPQGAFWIP